MFGRQSNPSHSRRAEMIFISLVDLSAVRSSVRGMGVSHLLVCRVLRVTRRDEDGGSAGGDGNARHSSTCSSRPTGGTIPRSSPTHRSVSSRFSPPASSSPPSCAAQQRRGEHCAADNIAVLDRALAQLPEAHRYGNRHTATSPRSRRTGANARRPTIPYQRGARPRRGLGCYGIGPL